jgi:hypothetical protein
MKTYAKVEVQLHAFLNSALDGGQWPASLPGSFIPGERDLGTHWISWWAGPETSGEKITTRTGNRTPVVHLAASVTPTVF